MGPAVGFFSVVGRPVAGLSWIHWIYVGPFTPRVDGNRLANCVSDAVATRTVYRCGRYVPHAVVGFVSGVLVVEALLSGVYGGKGFRVLII